MQQTQLAQVSGISTTAGGSNAFTSVELDDLIAGGVTSAAGSEITVVIKSPPAAFTPKAWTSRCTDLPAIAHQDPAGGIAPAGSPAVPALTMQELQPVVARQSPTGLRPASRRHRQPLPESAQFVITDLKGQGALALTGRKYRSDDATADGYGWFIDPQSCDHTDCRAGWIC